MAYPPAPTGSDVSTPYTTAALVGRWLPDAYQTAQLAGQGTSNVKGKVSIDDITDLINDRSREVDGRLWKAGARTPFPSITATNPQTPRIVNEVVTYLVAADIAAIIKFGQRGAEKSKSLGEMAEEGLAKIEKNPHSLGRVRVTTPEVFTGQMASGSVQTGLMISNQFRLKNRDVIAKSVRFTTSDGTEALRPEGLPFIYGYDWKMISPAQGLFWILNTQILTAVGASGGVVYDWGWVRLDRNTPGVAGLQGVGR